MNSLDGAAATDPRTTVKVQRLAQSWLPLLLTRVGIDRRTIAKLSRTEGSSEEFDRPLREARDACLLLAASLGRQERERSELAEAAATIADQLAWAIELDGDPAGVCIDRVSRHLAALLVAGPEGPTKLARVGAPTSPPWWTRLRPDGARRSRGLLH